MKVKTDTGEVTKTSYNRFHQGHRSKKDADDAMRNSQKKVERAFREKGFILKDTYVNKSKLLKFICTCGREAYMAYENVTKNKVGCGQCSRDKWHSTFKKAMKAKYGVEHASQNPELFKKQQESAFGLKKYKMPSGKIVEVQGYEPFCLDDLLRQRKIAENDIVVGFDCVPVIKYPWKDGLRYYYPDVYIPSQNRIIEVKSTYTYSLDPERNEVKWKTVADQGYEMECLFYNEKGKLLERRVITALRT
uniref:Restriction endonuclease n=1 Tax=Marseillevirus LCMAC101 TaxID=2506602 RepID=A0A481YS92_9VIRU|nr:MAG: restriction endonuclease [Marseillevirus LCMAC101]